MYNFHKPASLIVDAFLSLNTQQGLENRWKRHQECTKELHRGVQALGLELLVKNPVRRIYLGGAMAYKAVETMSRNPEGRGSIPRLGNRRSSLISIEHAELLRSTPSLVLCRAGNYGIACALRLGPTQSVTDFWG